jgi:23S rRNA pseudouridine1911/1915/1917 synthase
MQHFELPFSNGREARLDHFLVRALPQYSRSRLQSLVLDGCVRIDGSPARKAGQLIEPGSIVVIDIPAPRSASLLAEEIALDVLYEDDNVLVVNKPAGMTVHPGAGHRSGTLVNAVLAHAPSMQGIGGDERPGVVHRLDKETSGLIVLAKTDYALHFLQRQFQDREVEKAYLALVDGRPPSPSGRVEASIGRDPSHRKRMAIVADSSKGRTAVSEYSTRERFRQHTLLEVHPVTGRTHQVRLHCAFLGCPVAGDRVYGHKNPSIALERHFLHAWRLRLRMPNEQYPREFLADLPPELEQTLVSLRAEADRGDLPK